MAKDVNLTSQEWCDIVFEGKNKEYGAYIIRRTTSKRHLIALIAILIFAIFIALLPGLVKKIAEVTKSFSEGLTDITVLAQLDDIKEDEQEENRALKQEEPPPPPLKSTIKFTPPEIVASEDITDENMMKAQEDIIDSKVQISVYDVEGTDDKGFDLAELEYNKQVTQEVEKIYKIVDQNPEFPGGLEELYAFINRQVKYPPQAKENGIQGTTMVQFVVNRNGVVDKVTVFASSHPFLDKEAVRVVQSLPKWIPGKVNGESVASYYRIPISFKLQ